MKVIRIWGHCGRPIVITTSSKWSEYLKVFFTRGDSVANLNQVMLYVSNNEHTGRIKVVTVYENESGIPERLKDDLDFHADKRIKALRCRLPKFPAECSAGVV